MAELQAVGPASGHSALQMNKNLAVPPGAVEEQWPRTSPIGQISPHPYGFCTSLGRQGDMSQPL